MDERLGAAISYLRSRPVHERRILAITAYITFATVVLALWMNSFRASLSGTTPPAPPASEEESEGPRAETPLTASLSGLGTPFQALGQTVGDAIARFKKLDWKTPPGEARPKVLLKGGVMSERPPESLPPAAPAFSAAGTINRTIAPERKSEAALSRLVSPDSARATESSGENIRTTPRIAGMIGDGLSGIRQAIANFFRSRTGTEAEDE